MLNCVSGTEHHVNKICQGTYIMTTTAPWRVGDKPNHFKFSRESIANISAVLDFVLK